MKFKKLQSSTKELTVLRIFTLRHLLMMLIVGSVAFSTPSCTAYKEKKRIEQEKIEAQKRLREKIEQTNKELDDILNNENLSLDEKKKLLNDIKSRNLNDPDIKNKIAKLEAEIEEEESKIRKENEVKLTAQEQMLKAFSDIANAPTMDAANGIINNALNLCASESIPVLIIIAEENGVKDYDKPTNIKKYLEYVKDQKKFVEKVENIVLDENGKIKRVELRK